MPPTPNNLERQHIKEQLHFQEKHLSSYKLRTSKGTGKSPRSSATVNSAPVIMMKTISFAVLLSATLAWGYPNFIPESFPYNTGENREMVSTPTAH